MQLLLPPLLLHSRCFSRCSVLFFLFYGSWRCRTTCNYYGALAWLMNYYVYATRQSRQAAERKVNCNCNCNSKLSQHEGATIMKWLIKCGSAWQTTTLFGFEWKCVINRGNFIFGSLTVQRGKAVIKLLGPGSAES